MHVYYAPDEPTAREVAVQLGDDYLDRKPQVAGRWVMYR